MTTAKNTVAITGVGISMAVGIKDMQHMNIAEVVQMMSETVLKATPNHYYKLAWKNFSRYKFEGNTTVTHRKLAELELKGKVQGIITTNIDCMHTLAGSKAVAEIQGSFGVNQCVKCGKSYNAVQIWNKGKAPRCEYCEGRN